MSLGASMQRAIEVQMPGDERPFALIASAGDRPEVTGFVERLHTRMFMNSPILFARSKGEMEEALVREPATLVFTRGETITPILQDNIACGCYKRPRLFLLLVEDDPGELCRRGRWNPVFRSKIIRTFQWPALATRDGAEHGELFRQCLAIASVESGNANPPITDPAVQFVAHLCVRRDGENPMLKDVTEMLAFARRVLDRAKRFNETHITPELMRAARGSQLAMMAAVADAPAPVRVDA